MAMERKRYAHRDAPAWQVLEPMYEYMYWPGPGDDPYYGSANQMALLQLSDDLLNLGK